MYESVIFTQLFQSVFKGFILDASSLAPPDLMGLWNEPWFSAHRTEFQWDRGTALCRPIINFRFGHPAEHQGRLCVQRALLSPHLTKGRVSNMSSVSPGCPQQTAV